MVIINIHNNSTFILYNKDERVAFPSQGKLQLYGLCKADAGIYQCKVSNKGGTAVYTCKMFVEDGMFEIHLSA